MAAPALSVTGLCQSYGGRPLLRDISFAIGAGEYAGLIGANGAGKTTLIKSILDFISITAGRIELSGRPHAEAGARAGLAFLPEKFLPPAYLKGGEFLRYMAALSGLETGPGAVRPVCKLLDLDYAALARPVREYSKGMAQKLGLLACFLSRPSLLLLDEPLDGLDPKARAGLRRYLSDLGPEAPALLFSTHLPADAERVCQRILILHQGRLRFDGSPAQCREQYQAGDLEQAYLTCIED